MVAVEGKPSRVLDSEVRGEGGSVERVPEFPAELACSIRTRTNDRAGYLSVR